MSECKKQFKDFHNNIKLKEENEILISKRKIIIEKIRNSLPDETSKSFTIFNQGSYAMHTGVKPLDDDYDIDVGLYFEISKDDYKPITVKNWVYDALKDHTSDVKIKKPCVTVTYADGYHVDITVYAATNTDGKVYLAKGKPTSKTEDKLWEESNPKNLINSIRDNLNDKEDRKQFRRVVRYLKRWKDEKFNNGGGKPTGIALTSCAYHWLIIKKDYDPFTGNSSYKDLNALTGLVSSMISRFQDEYVECDGEYKFMPRLKVELPVAPYPELFEKMTNKQMINFKEKLNTLLIALENAEKETDPTDAAELLKKEFGDDFPVPPRSTTGKKSVAKAIIPSSESAGE